MVHPEQEWSSLMHVDGQEKWGEETGAAWKPLEETGSGAGRPSRGGRHAVVPATTAVRGRDNIHEVPNAKQQHTPGTSWHCRPISDWVRAGDGT